MPCPSTEADFIWWAAGSGEPQRAEPFIDYLRLAFRWGGFPGLEFDEPARAHVPLKALTRGLQPF